MSTAVAEHPAAEPDGEPVEGLPDDEEEHEGEQDDRPAEEDQPEPQSMSERDVEKMYASLDREASRHSNRVSEIMGEQAQILTPCPLCPPSIPGFLFPVEPPEEVKEAVRAAIGDAAALDYQPAPDARECDGCDGLGQVLTGSKVAAHFTKPCSSCNGAGYRIVKGPGETPTPMGMAELEAPTVNTPPADLPDTDPWGRTPGHPDYGRLPNYVR